MLKRLLLSITALAAIIPFVAQAQSLTISTIDRPPFAFETEQGWDGYSLELLSSVAQLNGWNIALQPETEFKTMLKNVEESLVDGAIANISMTSNREELMDFSLPIFSSGLQIATYKQSGNISIVNIILKSGLLWYVVIALFVLLAAGHIIWWFERNGGHDYFSNSYKQGVWDGFWWAFVLVIAGGFEDKVPKRWFSRMFAIFWMIMSLFFVSIIVAQITTALTVNELSGGIEDLEDLYGKRVGTIEGSTADLFLQEHNIQPVYALTFEGLMSNLEAKQYDAVMHDSPILKYYATTESNGLIYTVGDTLNTEPFAMVFPADSPLKEQFDIGMLKLYESGAFQEIHRRWFGN